MWSGPGALVIVLWSLFPSPCFLVQVPLFLSSCPCPLVLVFWSPGTLDDQWAPRRCLVKRLLYVLFCDCSIIHHWSSIFPHRERVEENDLRCAMSDVQCTVMVWGNTCLPATHPCSTPTPTPPTQYGIDPYEAKPVVSRMSAEIFETLHWLITLWDWGCTRMNWLMIKVAIWEYLPWSIKPWSIL